MDLSFFPPPPTEHAAKADWLEQIAGLTATEFRSARTRSVILAWARFLTFAAIPLGGYYLFGHRATWGAAVAVAAAVLFWLCVKWHGRAQSRALTLRYLRDVIAESQRRLGGEPSIIRDGVRPSNLTDWNPLFESGQRDASLQELSAQEIGDLDLFGEPLSLFGVLNRTSSPVGAAHLAHTLIRPSLSVDQTRKRQEAARWMAEHPTPRLQLMAAAVGMRPLASECRHLYETLRDATSMPNRGVLGLVRIWGLAGPIALALAIANLSGWDLLHVGWLPLVVVVMFNVVLIQLFLKPMREHIRPWLNLDEVVGRLRFTAETAVEVLPDDGLLGEQRRRLAASLGPGCLPTLERRIPLLFLGLSGFMHTIIDVLVFWDLQVLRLMEKCYIEHRPQLLGALAAMGECETYASMGAFAWEEPDASWPAFVQSSEAVSRRCHLEITDGRHPLIPAGEAVSNSLKLDANIWTWIITGSNMSGKSTFLRMVATNVLLAQNGSATTAGGLRLTPLEILTDLRIRDDLSRKESYFLAEVRQVRRMVEATQSNRPILALIDEPFRGTNSAERVAAASAVITALIEGSGVHLVATHDAALTRLGDADHAANYHFAEAFEDEHLVFDHTLRPGAAKSRNALRVLRAEGYPANLVAQAEGLLPTLSDE